MSQYIKCLFTGGLLMTCMPTCLIGRKDLGSNFVQIEINGRSSFIMVLVKAKLTFNSWV